jgi:hypothetical protein
VVLEDSDVEAEGSESSSSYDEYMEEYSYDSYSDSASSTSLASKMELVAVARKKLHLSSN